MMGVMETKQKREVTGLEMNLLHAEDVESAVLGAVMLETNSLQEVLGFVRAEMFYQRKHQNMWRAIESLVAKGLEPDIIMVAQELAAMGKLEESGGAYEVARKTANLASSAHLWEHVRVLYEYYLRRSISECLLRRLGEAADLMQDVFDVLTNLASDLEKLKDGSPMEEHLQDMKEVMKRTCDHIRDRVSRSVNGVTGIPTGIPELDQMTGGWQPGNLIFTAGRPGMGKTQLGLKFALHAAERGYKVLFYTLEMMSEEVGERVLLMRAPDLYNKVKGGHVSESEVDDLCHTGDEVAEYRMMVDDTPYVGIDRLCAGAKTVKSRWGLDLLVVDYLQLVGSTPRSGRTREQEVAECSRRLKALARTLECPVIVACQLNRQVEQTFDHRPELKHLRESGAIEQDADLVIMLHRSERGGDRKRCGLIVAKNRHGEVSQPNSSVEVELF